MATGLGPPVRAAQLGLDPTRDRLVASSSMAIQRSQQWVTRVSVLHLYEVSVRVERNTLEQCTRAFACKREQSWLRK